MRMVRRNQGVLAERPQFEQGGAPLPQMNLVSPIAEATLDGEPVMPATEPNAPAASPQMTDVQKAEAAAAELIQAAERQRQLAGSPLNRILSGIGGVIGAPFNFLSAALGEGDMRDVTAPFRPQQTANEQFQRQVLGIQDSLAKIRENAAQQQASLASAAAAGLQSRANIMTEFNTRMANLAVNAGRTPDPQATWRIGLAKLSLDPMMGAMVSQMGYDQMDWAPDLAASIAVTKDGAARIDNALKPNIEVLQPGGTALVFDSPYATTPSSYIQQGTGVVPMGGAAPAPSSAPPLPPGFVLEK